MKQVAQNEPRCAREFVLPSGLVIAIGDDANRRLDALIMDGDEEVGIEGLDRVGSVVVP